MKLTDVARNVAIERMYIWARHMPVCEKDTMAHTLMCGGIVTYLAYDATDKLVGRTRIEPQDFNPVTLVTETTF